MDHQQRLKTCIDEIALQGPELLRQLQTQLGDAPGEARPSLGLLDDTSRPTVQSLRKKLIEAATKLIQLATDTDGYLEHLANGVSRRCFTGVLGSLLTREAHQPHTVSGIGLRALAHRP